MLELIYNQIIFFASIALIVFLPGWFLLLAVFGKNKKTLSSLERFVLSFGLGIVIIDFIAFSYSKLNIKINALSSVLGALIFSGICFGIYKYKNQKSAASPLPKNDQGLFDFSKNQLILTILFLFLTIFLKTAYLTTSVAPTSTDLGHHMYWAKEMSETGKLPSYDRMPDFIIGEHIIFGIIASITNLSFFSAFPVVILYLINLLSILTVFILVLRVFENKNIAILSLLFLGVIFPVSSPQAKFVSGGVAGNIFGNLFLPLVFYLYFRALEFFQTQPLQLQKDSFRFLSLGIFATFGLFYTHHLSAFIFIFIVFLLGIIFLTLNYSHWEEFWKSGKKIILNPWTIGTLVLGIIFFFFIFTPTYINPKAVDTAVGAPSKSTRTGLNFSEMESTNGEIRLSLGILGFIALLLSYKKRNIGYALFSAWLLALLLMSMRPNWIFIDLPSSRVANYTSYPLAVFSAYGLWLLFQGKIFSKLSSQKETSFNEAGKISQAVFFATLAFIFSFSLLDFSAAMKNKKNISEAIQVFDASKYLAQKTNSGDFILKDHNYLTADSWMKLFFMRGYKYPESRGYFKRYEDETKPREMCTLWMISLPASPEAEACFSETKTNFIAINPKYDSAQFQRLNNFDQVYNNGYVMVYYKRP